MGGSQAKFQASMAVDVGGFNTRLEGTISAFTDRKEDRKEDRNDQTTPMPLNCPICLETYKLPVKMLQCGHSFCYSCVDGRFSIRGEAIRCPSCGANTYLSFGGVRGLPSNAALERIVAWTSGNGPTERSAGRSDESASSEDRWARNLYPADQIVVDSTPRIRRFYRCEVGGGMETASGCDCCVSASMMNVAIRLGSNHPSRSDDTLADVESLGTTESFHVRSWLVHSGAGSHYRVKPITRAKNDIRLVSGRAAISRRSTQSAPGRLPSNESVNVLPKDNSRTVVGQFENATLQQLMDAPTRR